MNPPGYVGMEEATRELSFLSEKSGDVYVQHLKQNTGVNVEVPHDRVQEHLNPKSEVRRSKARADSCSPR